MRIWAVIGVALLIGGCGAPVQSGPPAGGGSSPAPAAVPSATPPVSPPTFEGLDARVRQATAEAAESGAEIETAVLDRATGQLVSSGATTAFPIASVGKLFIADDLLLQEAQGTTTLSTADHAALDRMLRSSDDAAAQQFWERSGQNAVIERIVARYGLTATTPPPNGHWDVTMSTAADLVRYYDMLLDGTGGLPAGQAGLIIGDLAQSTPTGADGYPQRFGIPDALTAEPVAVKQGWFCCWNGGNQLHVSTGTIGSDHRYVMAISSLEPDDAAEARETLTRAVRTMFPAGRI